jgi:hypothetical protein
VFVIKPCEISGIPRIFFWRGGGMPGIFFGVGGGVKQIHLKTECREREWGSGGCSPLVRGFNLHMSETCILIRLLRMYFPRNWKFG